MSALVTYAMLFFSLYFEVFLLVSFLERRIFRVAQKTPASAPLPKVCIVVPCYNEERTLPSTLASLLKLDYPSELLDILVVDDGSADSTLAVARTFEGGSVRVLHKENGGKHSAMNAALQHTDAQFIGCLDADSIVEPAALREIVPVFADQKIAAVTPGIHVRDPHTLLQHMQNVEYHLGIFYRFMLAGLGSLFITPGPFSFFRTDVVRELGGWRYAHSTEDMEMALRIQSAGHLIANAPRAIVHTLTPATLAPLFKQRIRWTYGWLRNAIDYRFMIGNRKYGNLGLIILPSALVSIMTGIYFFMRTLWTGGASAIEEITKIKITGFHMQGSYDLFYVDTSAMLFLIWMSVALILVLICVGSRIGTGRHIPPLGTPLFFLFYSFLMPLWLSAAVVRAFFKTGVKWR